MYQHIRNVRCGKEKNPVKRDIIQNALSAGRDIIFRVSAYFWDEKAAYRHEAELIRELEPIANGVAAERDNRISFFGLITQYCVTRDRDIARKLLRLFPDKAMPSDEHRKLRNAIREAIA